MVAVADPRTNSVLVSASHDTMAQIALTIGRLDATDAKKQHVYVVHARARRPGQRRRHPARHVQRPTSSASTSTASSLPSAPDQAHHHGRVQPMSPARSTPTAPAAARGSLSRLSRACISPSSLCADPFSRPLLLARRAACVLAPAAALLPSAAAARPEHGRATSGTDRRPHRPRRPPAPRRQRQQQHGGHARQYRNNTQLGDALIQIDPETRSLVIVADEDTHNEIIKVIKNLDRPKPQVLIKVLFAQVTLDNSTTSAWRAATRSTSASRPSQCHHARRPSPASHQHDRHHHHGGTTTINVTTTTTTATVAAAVGAASFGLEPLRRWPRRPAARFFRLNTHNATGHALRAGDQGQGQRALAPVDHGAQQPGGRHRRRPGSAHPHEQPDHRARASTINSVTYQDVGIILRVTPFITVNKTVEMIVSPEISSLSHADGADLVELQRAGHQQDARPKRWW